MIAHKAARILCEEVEQRVDLLLELSRIVRDAERDAATTQDPSDFRRAREARGKLADDRDALSRWLRTSLSLLSTTGGGT